MKQIRFYLYIILTNLYCLTSISQDMDVYYSCYYNTALPKVVPATLQIKGSISVFEEHFDKSREWDNGKDIFKEFKLNNVEHYRGRKNKKLNSYIKRDVNYKTISIIDFIGTKNFLIKDFFVELSWNLTNDKKIISGYECIKAETIFRGLKWTTWFAPDLAFNMGPWKLHGLPGLILEAYDESKKYHFLAEKIVLNSSSDLFFPIDDLPTISIKEAVLDQIKKREAINADISRGEISITDKYKLESMEPIYEWEEETK